MCFEKKKSTVRPVLKGGPNFLPFNIISQSLFKLVLEFLLFVTYECVQHCQHCLPLLKKKSLGVEFAYVQEEFDP